MSARKQKNIKQFFADFIAKLRKWLIKIGSPIRISRRFVRSLYQMSKKGATQAGFVLPTVVMVTTVVTLLVVVMVARSSERARTASNARVEQVFKSAATPVVDRARAKLEELINQGNLLRSTPSEDKLNEFISQDDGKYTFNDEIRLQLNYDISGATSIKYGSPNIRDNEYVSSAWKYPIDTDNNGKFDTFGLYSIQFRSRPATSGTRDISPLEARALPMDEGTLTANCQSASVGNVATSEGWFKSGDKLKKSFFIYTATIPITDSASFPTTIPGYNSTNWETFTGAKSISALELQQDRARSPVNNNAVWFEGDLELARVATFRINGRIYTGGNLMVGALGSEPITFYQVSSSGTNPTNPNLLGSCYYQKQNSELVVGGNVVMGDAFASDLSTLTGSVSVDLFKGVGVRPDTASGARQLIDQNSQSVASSLIGAQIAFNDFAYNRRVAALVAEAMTRSFSVPTTLPSPFTAQSITGTDPLSVKEGTKSRILDEGLSTSAQYTEARRAAYTVYFSERTRKVPFNEVAFGVSENFTTISPLLTQITRASGTYDLEPPLTWALPSYSNSSPVTVPAAGYAYNGKGILGSGSLGLNVGSSLAKPYAADPDSIANNGFKEEFLGDRVLVGNNLPAQWPIQEPTNSPARKSVGTEESNFISTTGSVFWNQPGATATASSKERYRNTQAVSLSNLGVSDRGGFWEISTAADPAVSNPALPTDIVPNGTPTTGGLRVIANAGIYTRLASPSPATTDGPGTFLPRFQSGVKDDTATANIDESLSPLWNGQPIDNPITGDIDERKFSQLVVWPDTMPMTRDTATAAKGDLQMRAAAVYHYKYDAYNPNINTDYQTPIACVSSYYDPSTPATARNRNTLPWNAVATGRSNNGIVYSVGQTAVNISIPGIAYDNTSTSATYGQFTGIDPDASNPNSPAAIASLGDRLAYQANLIFPNGRFANDPLRKVLRQIITDGAGNAATAKLTLPQQSTLDSNICALQILDGSISALPTITPSINGALFPHGTIREAAFLDAREVKSLNRNESLTEAANGNNPTGTNSGIALTSNNRGDIYDLEIEQRQPLEIRTTDIDLDRLRGSTITGGNNSGVATEYLLPYSGLVYASRDDALKDLSYYNTDASLNPIVTTDVDRENLSATDFKLDPTRRPSGIRLVNGLRLWRSSLTTGNLGAAPNANVELSSRAYSSFPFTDPTRGEKGLILVSNLPVYIKGQNDPPTPITTKSGFNLHTRQEFTNLLNENVSSIATIWNNFYTRNANNGATDKLDPNFGCRPNPTTTCTLGDEWRPATIIADSATVTSAASRDGYRSDGDYDLRNNENTSTSINWQSSLNTNAEKLKTSSYVTQRRKLGLFNNSFVTSSNWLASRNSDGGTGSTSNLYPAGNRNTYLSNNVTPVQRRISFGEYGMEICRKLPVSECTASDWVKPGAGTTVVPDTNTTTGLVTTVTDAPRYIAAGDNRYARRLSFTRFDDIYKDGNMGLVMATSCPASSQVWPMPIGVTNGNNSPTNATPGYTYPMVMGGLGTPFKTANRNSYGTIPCPPPNGATIGILTGNINQPEGRTKNTPNSLSTAVGSTNLPAVNWSTNVGNTTGAHVYKRFDFTIQGNDLTAATGPVKATFSLIPSTSVRSGIAGSPFQVADLPGATTQTGTDYLENIYDSATGALITPAVTTSGATVGQKTVNFEVTIPGYPYTVAQINRNLSVLVVRDSAEEDNETLNLVLNARTNAAPALNNSITITIGQVRTAINNVNNDSTTNVNQCPFTPPSPNPTAYVVTGPVVTTTVTGDDGVVTTNTTPRNRTRYVNSCTPTPTPPTPTPTPTPPTPTPPTTGVDYKLPDFNHDRTKDPLALLPVPSSAKGAAHMPIAALLPNLNLLTNTHIAAAYPSLPPTTNQPFNPPSTGGSNTGLYPAWTSPTSITVSNKPLTTGQYRFPDYIQAAPPVGTTGGEVPLLMGKPSPTANNDGLKNTLPTSVNKALWYRTADSANGWMGEEDRIKHWDGANLLIYHHSWPAIGTGGGSLKGNLNHFGRLILPETVCINTSDATVDPLCKQQAPSPFDTFGATTKPATLANLNLPYNPHFPSDNDSLSNGASATVPASAYAVCGVTGSSQAYQSIQAYSQNHITGSSCPAAPRQAIVNFRNDLLTPALYTNGVNLGPLNSTGTQVLTASDTAADRFKVNYATLPSGSITGSLKLEASSNNPDPVFILRAPNAVGDFTITGLYVTLQGVDPNKVFWVFERVGTKALTIQGGSTNDTNGNGWIDGSETGPLVTTPTVLVGNFIGTMPASGGTATGTDSSGLNISSSNLSVRGARFLGFRALTPTQATNISNSNPPSTGVDNNALITAMTSVDQPVVLPVLQFHAPDATSASSASMPQPSNVLNGSINSNPSTNANSGQWAERAVNSEINAYFVAGSAPSRVGIPYTPSATAGTTTATGTETGGGLANFIRLTEGWYEVPLKIAGGFIQNSRSKYATAPFSATAPYVGTTTKKSDIQTVFINPETPTGTAGNALSGYVLNYQSITDATQKVPFYSPPIRLWGFDVGLLTQSADRFAERFATAIPGSNEFFREIGADDPWIKTLLCAVEPVALGATNPATSAINPNVTVLKGTIPTNYQRYTLGSKDRPTDCSKNPENNYSLTP